MQIECIFGMKLFDGSVAAAQPQAPRLASFFTVLRESVTP
jgi:hypothetical protein